MVDRISRAQMFMEMARTASKRSTCFRLNVGAIITQENNPIAVGWNGQEAGAEHCLGNSCPGVTPGNCGTIHAEVNALTKAAKILGGASLSIKSKLVDLYCTDSPCPPCVDFIIQNSALRVARIFYEKPYRLAEHLDKLREYADNAWPHRVDIVRSTEVYLVTPAGYTVDHFTHRVVELP